MIRANRKRKDNSFQNNKMRKSCSIGVLILAIAVLLECFVFNFRHWESLSYQKIDIDTYNGQVLDLEKDGATLKVEGLDIVTKNLYIDGVVLDSAENPVAHQTVTIKFSATDSANELPYQLGERTIQFTNERSRFFRLNLFGNTHSIELSISSPYENAEKILIKGISFNCPVPLEFSVYRIILIAAIMSAAFFLRPQSDIYKIQFNEKWKYRRSIIVLCASLITIAALLFIQFNCKSGDAQEINTQYHIYAQSLAKGYTYLDIEPSQELLSMENPYDSALRQKLVGETGFKRDYAFFNGKYYCYFGVFPVVTTFLPYYILTGENLPFSISMSIYGVLLVAGAFSLLHKIFERFFSNRPLFLYILSCYLLLTASGLWFAFRGVMFYTLPILCAAVLTMWGLYFAFAAKQRIESGNRYAVYLSISAVCMALNALARPQFLIAYALLVLIFWDELIEIFCKRKFKKWWPLVLSAFIPTVIIAALTMWWNYVRFGSVFDFGANYNLCSNDMRVRGWKNDRIILGIYYYLFAPVITTPKFPFITQNVKQTYYLGQTIYESVYGGMISLLPAMSAVLLCFGKRFSVDCKMKKYLAQILLILAIIVLVVDTQMAGIVSRYRMDFGWMIVLSFILVIGTFYDSKRLSKINSVIIFSTLISIATAAVYETLMLLDVKNIALYFHPETFYKIKSLIEFWA